MTTKPTAPSKARPTIRHRRKPKLVPSLHLLMIQIAAVGVLLGGLGYFIAPIAKQAFFERLAEWSMVFLFGKFTNGFGSKSFDGADKSEDDNS